MNNHGELIYALSTSRMLLKNLVSDLTAEERLFRVVPEANCVDWIVGHLLLSETRFHKIFKAETTEIPADYESRFARNDVAPHQADYGDTSELLGLFIEARERTIEAVSNLEEADLDLPLENAHPMFATLAEAAVFCGLHVTLHTGQISLIRRALGKPPVI